MHLVHWNNKYTDIIDALKHSDGIAVIGVFYEVRGENANLAGILGVVPTGTTCEGQDRPFASASACGVSGHAAVPSDLKLDDFLPADRADYYYYQVRFPIFLHA
jgi:hypothetical protein